MKKLATVAPGAWLGSNIDRRASSTSPMAASGHGFDTTVADVEKAKRHPSWWAAICRFELPLANQRVR